MLNKTSNKKIYILLPDGVGIRNFVYTDFISQLLHTGTDVTLWADDYLLNIIEYKEINKLSLSKAKPTTVFAELYKNAWVISLLKYQAKIYKNKVYLSYIFPNRYKGFNEFMKNILVKCLTLNATSYYKINKLKEAYIKNIKKTVYYKEILNHLKEAVPDLIFCTNQRFTKSISPLLAAKELNIPTACFIFSWDNLPKATLVISTDYYFVWSDFMKYELKTYHPEIKEHQIYVVGTPQFTPYFNKRLQVGRDEFANRYCLPISDKWVCFSGDDVTTSPNDHFYLADFAKAITLWNATSTKKIHIIFRRCPVDISNRYDDVLNEYKNVITAIKPEWEPLNKLTGWATIIPQKSDSRLLTNTILHCEFTVNIGSTMAFDFAVFGKPCIYINYNIKAHNMWDIHKVYKYIHFASMPTVDAVLWVNDSSEWLNIIQKAIYDNKKTVAECKKWLEKISLHPLGLANNRIVESLLKIMR